MQRLFEARLQTVVGATARRAAFAGVTLLAVAASGRAQSVPSPADVTGAAAGERFTTATEAVRYAEALAAASERVSWHRYGVSVEGRPLGVLVLRAPGTSDEDLAAVRAGLARLSDPDLPPGEASRIARSLPAVAWLMAGIHGDESSSTEAALWIAWDLARDAPGAEGVLDSLVVLIEPVANPDGRDRYVGWYRSVRGDAPDPEPTAMEHRPPWPGGRTNHFLFDLNRDWAWATQQETRARVAEWRRWSPQVHVDFHEMGYGSSYFFFPAANPVHPLLPDYTVRWGEYFGRRLAAEFDRRGWPYFTGETFDLFYPGYGDSWPSLNGAIGMTFEQAGGGAAGLAVRRPDGHVLTLAERLDRHREAGLATLHAAAARKTDLLREYAAFHSTSAEGDVLLVPGPSEEALEALASLLDRQGIRMERATSPFRVPATPHRGFRAREDFPPGTIRVPARQRRGRLALALLQPDAGFDGEAMRNTYDITAWSLPYAYGVEAHIGRTGSADGFVAFTPGEPGTSDVGVAPPSDGAAPFGWLVEPGFATAGPLVRWLEAGGRAVALEEAFEVDGRAWPAGTRFLPRDGEAGARLAASGLDAAAVPVRSGRTERGRDLGTPRSLVLQVPAVGLLGGPGIFSSSFGAARHLLERRARIPYSALRLEDVGRLDLDEWDVLVLPDGFPGRELAGGPAEALEAWVRGGGTLVASGGSARWVGTAWGGVEVRASRADSLDADERLRRNLRTREERRSDAWDSSVNGVILPVRIDEAHPLAWGLGRGNAAGRAFVLHTEDLSFEPAEGIEPVLAFEDELRPVAGVMSESKLRDIAASAWLVTRRLGRGRLVLFADDPLFRQMWPSNFVLFTNALLHGPALR
ncbi:MAG: M14 family zinc carboxypeptidase [Gemmatimonadota bacterium]|nr:M14 family zinc carboxypeptidase [Gemmatimonadota bacterium]